MRTESGHENAAAVATSCYAVCNGGTWHDYRYVYCTVLDYKEEGRMGLVNLE